MRAQNDKSRKPRAQAPTQQPAASAERVAAALAKLLAALAPRNDDSTKNR